MQLPSTEFIEVGVDEAGRGPLFGPVVAAAVIMPNSFAEDDTLYAKIKDSKKCSEKLRKQLKDYIKEKSVAFGIGVASVDEIDKLNILQANYLAMHRALDQVYSKVKFNRIMVDGPMFKPYLPHEEDSEWIQHMCVIDGDALHLNIAAASILAKTFRDEIIEDMCAKDSFLNEKYGLAKNKGYGTRQHMEGLKKFGPSEHHRKSFKPVQNLISL